ncbi:hypothetical protein Lalb_Chr18g0052411 [Lupinus albus]|uniref:Uncharacterized protein n=1 Tax=Lupinus albus TaxID=3870 RepID=A0A6A4NKZ2_LUPAL|nr:hypothetical protein Lalb_Chr18g0052411 [Lupinus albus]
MIDNMKPSLVFLKETHCQFLKARYFWLSLSYNVVNIEEVVGHNDDLWVLASNDIDFSISVISSCHQVITHCLSKNNAQWFCSAIYATHVPSTRDLLWSHLENMRSSIGVL